MSKDIRKKQADDKPKMTKKKITAISVIAVSALVCVGMVIALLVMGFGSLRPIKSSGEDARVVGRCGEYDVRYEELRYITLLHKASLNNELGEYSSLSAEKKAEYEKELEARVYEDIESIYVVLTVCEEYGIDTDSRDADKYVQGEIEKLVSEELGGKKKDYKAWLERNHLTDAFLRLVYKTDYLENELLDHFVENKIDIEYDNSNKAEFVDYILEESDFIRTIHAFYPKKHDAVNTSNSKQRAEQTAAELALIEDDEERERQMRSAIGSAPFTAGYSTTGNGFYFTRGQMNEEYERESFELSHYGVSGVVESNEGYYVIMRLPMVREHLSLATVPELLRQYQYAVLKEYEDKTAEKIAFAGNELFAELELAEIN